MYAILFSRKLTRYIPCNKTSANLTSGEKSLEYNNDEEIRLIN